MGMGSQNCVKGTCMAGKSVARKKKITFPSDTNTRLPERVRYFSAFGFQSPDDS